MKLDSLAELTHFHMKGSCNRPRPRFDGDRNSEIRLQRFGRKLTRTQRLILREVTRTAKQTSLNTLFTVHYSTRRSTKEETNRKELVNIRARGLGQRIIPGIILFTIFVYTINEIIFPPFFFKLEDWRGTKTCFRLTISINNFKWEFNYCWLRGHYN